MSKFRIKYQPGGMSTPPDEEVDAVCFQDNGDWIDFYSSTGGSPRSQYSVLRVRAKDVARIERVKE